MTPLFHICDDPKDNVKLNLSLGSFVAAVGFGIAGFAAPPVGDINSSVLYLVAQLLVLTATFLGLEGLGLQFLSRKPQKGEGQAK